MATQTISTTAFETLCAEVADAIAASDYKLALSKYAQAQAVLNGLLNTSISTSQDSITRIQSLRDLKDAIMSAMSSGGDQDESRFVKTRVGYRG